MNPKYSLEGLIRKLQTLATWCEEPTHWKRPWCWARLKAGEGGDRGWDGWVASLTQWTWVWAISGTWWRTGKTGMLQSMRLQRVGHDLATEQQQRRGLGGWLSQFLSHLLRIIKHPTSQGYSELNKLTSKRPVKCFPKCLNYCSPRRKNKMTADNPFQADQFTSPHLGPSSSISKEWDTKG